MCGADRADIVCMMLTRNAWHALTGAVLGNVYHLSVFCSLAIAASDQTGIIIRLHPHPPHPLTLKYNLGKMKVLGSST